MSSITPALFQFLMDLHHNNNREWFEANKHRYEQEVRGPLLQFIADFGARLPEISENFVADTRKSGGSLFRINRDVRFGKDKTPYKTNAGVQFRHSVGKDVHAPGFYLHLATDEIFAGVGIWHPDNSTLSKIREAIVEKPELWYQVSHEESFTAQWSLSGDSLKRPPKGFPAEHPYIVDLKRKDFVAGHSLTVEDVCAPNFLDHYTDLCKQAAPFMKFITESIGLAW